MADLLARFIEVQNRLTAPLAPFFLGQEGTCPLSVTFGKHFVAYFPVWLLILVLQWAALHLCFSKVTKVFLRRMGLTRMRTERSSAALWEAGTALGAAMLCSSQLESVDPHTLTLPSSLDWPPPHLTMYLFVLATCQAQGVFAQLRARTFGTEILVEVTRVIVLIFAYFARWADFGFLFCFHTSVIQIFVHFGRLILSFKRGLHYLVLVVFFVLTVLWTASYAYFVPWWILFIVVTPILDDELQLALISLFVALTLHFIFALLFSPLIISCKGIFRRKPLTEWLELSLFPNIDLKLTQMKKEISEEELSRHKLIFTKKKS
ncbi:uncharacterized protein LOC132201033 isoform X2 [Neocloeon triangulifer]|uniref:uncharacterized protein LOC132201033 isoform X2 n=1 Tax=Neocloeon triangulifer TaxID=2078957 RepID=UPI00286F0DB2|nr:uncharacterized protein LOC132201033 isoform X2 [Neocloeon triangulifer]